MVWQVARCRVLALSPRSCRVLSCRFELLQHCSARHTAGTRWNQLRRCALAVTLRLLEPALLELQRRRVLGDRPDLRVVEAVGRCRLDLDRDVQRHAGRSPKRAQDLVGELLEVRCVAVGLQALAAEEPRLVRRLRLRARGSGPGPGPGAGRPARPATRWSAARPRAAPSPARAARSASRRSRQRSPRPSAGRARGTSPLASS